ncbi:MAG: hypothetical protein LUH47_01185, partial [Clostridiales bacterium]|nr:hypothetical protein [Clostridiales bacterium]
MKKKIAAVLAAVMAVGSFSCFSYGASSVNFTARVNGETAAKVDLEDVAVVTMTIETADSYTFYSMQDYIKFDTDYFELDEDSISVKQIISSGEYVDLFTYSPIKAGSVYDRVFVNRVSLTGVDFEAEEIVITFTLKPLKEGQTQVTHYRTEMLDENGSRYTVNEVNASVVIGNYEETTETTTAAPTGDDDETTTETV